MATRDIRDLSNIEKQALFAAYAEDLAAYPEDIIKAACRNPPRWKFWPELGPLLDRADALMKERQQFAPLLSPESVERARQRKAAAAAEAEAAARRREEILAYEGERDRRWKEAEEWRRANPGPYREAVRTYASVDEDATGAGGMDPITGKPRLSTSEAMKKVQQELASFRLPDADDPKVQDWLRKMGVDPAEVKSAPVTTAPAATAKSSNRPAWPRVRHPTPRRARR